MDRLKWIWFDENEKPVIAFCGSATSGKTSILDAYCNRLDGYGLPYFKLSNLTRSYYAQCGIATEKDFKSLENPDDQKKFQLGMLQYFVDQTELAVKDNPGCKIVCDRSVFDHLAYCVKSSNLNLDEYRALREHVVRYSKFLQSIFFFPYPVSFTKDVQDDGFRYATITDNVILSALMQSHLRNIPDHIYTKNRDTVFCFMRRMEEGALIREEFYLYTMEDRPVADRVQYVLDRTVCSHVKNRSKHPQV